MQRELNLSHIMASLAFSLYPLGFGLGPLVLAPISEVYGRNPMYFVSTILFTCEYSCLVHNEAYTQGCADGSTFAAFRLQCATYLSH